MDSTGVNRQIRRVIRPLLKQHGFDAFAERWTWRHQEHKVDCIHFWSPYNWVEAEFWGVTTLSFQIDLGIYWLDIPPWASGPKEKGGRLLPKDYQCHIRRHVRPAAENVRAGKAFLWCIEQDGANLEAVVRSAGDALARDALPWFDRFGDPESFLELLLTSERESEEVGWGYGAKDSPNRHYLTGYMARICGHSDLATAHLEAYLASVER